jgi:quinol monooxygenase YgiN
MIVVRVRLQIEKQDTGKLLTFLNGRAAEVDHFKGCEAYRFYQDPIEGSRFLLYEEWSDQESFDVYKNSDEFKSTMAFLSPLMGQKPDSAYYEAERIGP